MPTPGFRIEVVDYAQAQDELRAVREPVFVQEQQVPLALEWDELDPLCVHVIARDDTGRLTPERKIGRMAVLREWRGKGVGDALLSALMAQAWEMGWPAISLNAQVSAEPFYARHGFVPFGPGFEEAGIQHQAMRRNLKGPTPIENGAAAVAITTALVLQARRALVIYSRELDPGLLDNAAVLEALGPRGFLVNVARGRLVNEADLADALTAGRIAGAGLDVFVDEPRVPLALRQSDQVTLQAHRASATWETRTAMAQMVLDSVNQALAGERPAMSLTT